MKAKKLFATLPAFFVVFGMVACGGGGDAGGGQQTTWTDIETYEMPENFKGSGEIKVWVGKESVLYYQSLADQWVSQHKALNEEFNFTVVVEDHDSGGIAGSMENDATVCADIITSAHDNIGKLAQEKLIKPLNSKALYTQALTDNPETFKSVIYSVVDDVRAIYGMPYIAQALFLMYNKDYVTAEQAKTMEGLQEAARAASQAVGHEVKALTVTGDDGFNFSFSILAQNNETHETSMKIYGNGTKQDCWAQGEDSVANLQFMRRFYAEENGFTWQSSSGWEVDVKQKGVLAVVGGSWKYNAFASNVGATSVGVAMIPTWTLTEADVSGTTMKAGTVMRGGTFNDCKCFLINAKSEGSKYIAEQSLIQFLSSVEAQNGSFRECDNLPAYKGSTEYIESIKNEITVQKYQLAKAQTEMSAYSIPQPFLNGTLNSYYYSQGAPSLYTMVVENTDGLYGTTQAAREILYRMQHIWEKGKDPSNKMPATLPAEI